MLNPGLLIRPATEGDLPAIADIYGHEASTGTSTFDTEPRSVAEWRRRLAISDEGDHLLVGVARGTVVGYARSAAYRDKPAYRHTRETSIYLSPDAQGQGLGRQLYGDLLTLLATEGVHLAVAAVALPNPASTALHRACGFAEVGVMREVGRKFGTWIDVAWWQKPLVRA